MSQGPEPTQMDRTAERRAPNGTKESSDQSTLSPPLGGLVAAFGSHGPGDAQAKLASAQILNDRRSGAARALIIRRLQQGIGNQKARQLVAQLQSSSQPASVIQRECSCGDTCSACHATAAQASGEPPFPQRQADPSAHRDEVAEPSVVPSSSAGEPIDRRTRDFIEPRFGSDFSEVRVHTDTASARSADALTANAYTTGRDIYFAAGKYAPATTDGQNLLAHEFAHVLQQRTGQASSLATKPAAGIPVSAPDDILETEAQQAADAVTGSGTVDPRALSPLHSPVVQRDPAPAPGIFAPDQTLPPGSIFAGDPLYRYARLRSGASPQQWTWLNNAARARAISQGVRAGSADAAERDRLAANGMASIDVPVTSLLATSSLPTAPLGWKLLAFQAAVGGDTSAAGSALRDSIIARWLSAFSDTGAATVQVSLIDPDGIGPDAATLTFQYAGRPLGTTDGTITLGQIDPAGLQTVLASFSAELTDVDAFEKLNALVNGAIAHGRTMIQAGHAGFSADDVHQWSAVLTELQGQVAAFQSTHPDAAQSIQTVSASLNAFIGSEATPFATEHTAFLKQNQPPKSWGESTNDEVHSQMGEADKMLKSDSIWDNMAAGYVINGTSETAAPYVTANFFSGGNLEVSRQFHQAFRDGHISLEAFQAGSAAAARRGAWVGAANAILMVASFGLAGPILGTAPSTLAVIGYGGFSAAISTAVPMTISSLYTGSVDMRDPNTNAIWSQGAYTPGQIALSSAISFGIGAGLGAISRIFARMPESSMQELVVASMQGRSLQTIPGVLSEDLGPGLVRLTMEGEPGFVELTPEGFTAYAPAGPGRTPTVVHSAPWVEPTFKPSAIAEHPLLGDVRGSASYMNAQTGQGMMFGVTPEGYFAYAPRTSTPFMQGKFPIGEAGPVSVPGMAPFEMPLLGPGLPIEPVSPMLGPSPAIDAASTLAEVQSAAPAFPLESQLRISRALTLFPGLRSVSPSVDEIRLALSQSGLQLQPEEIGALQGVANPGAQYSLAPPSEMTPAEAAEYASTQTTPAPLTGTGSSFADPSNELGLEAAGTVPYQSTASAALGARSAGLTSSTSLGFQTHATAPRVRGAFNVTGRQLESVHVFPQVAYRALRAQGFAVSEGRALTTLLPRTANAAFDGGWVPQWNAAVNAGRAITAGDAYSWLSRAINAVDPQIINGAAQGAINDRLRTEMYSELGLTVDSIIVPARP